MNRFFLCQASSVITSGNGKVLISTRVYASDFNVAVAKILPNCTLPRLWKC